MEMRFRTIAGLAAAGLLGWATIAGADDAIEERVTALEEKLAFDFGAVTYGSYQYNFNEPDSGVNSLRSLDPEHNSFTFDLFQLQLAKEGPGGVGFGAKLDFGKTARRVASDWNGDGALSDSEETNDFEAQDVYLTYAPEWAGGVSLKAGKFATLLGAEVIEAPSNPNFTRSFLFGFAIPFTHTGVLFSAPLGEMVTLNAGVVNGWDNVVDNNDGKTFLGGVGITPAENIAIYLNGVFGPEKTDSGSDPRGVVDLVTTLGFDPVSLSFNFDYGSEGSAAPDGGDATWIGFAGIVGFDLRSAADLPLGVFLRGEVFDDQDGARTGTEQTLTEVTGTLKCYLTENLTLWAEFRHDWSGEDSFEEEGSITVVDPILGPTTTAKFTDSQDTALIALSYAF